MQVTITILFIYINEQDWRIDEVEIWVWVDDWILGTVEFTASFFVSFLLSFPLFFCFFLSVAAYSKVA